MERFSKPLNRIDYVLEWVILIILFSFISYLFFHNEISTWKGAQPHITFGIFLLILVPYRIAMVNMDSRRSLDIFGDRFHKSDILFVTSLANIFEILLTILPLSVTANILGLLISLILLFYRVFLVFKKGKPSHWWS